MDFLVLMRTYHLLKLQKGRESPLVKLLDTVGTPGLLRVRIYIYHFMHLKMLKVTPQFQLKVFQVSLA